MQIVKLATALPENEYSTEKLMETFPCQLPEGVIHNIINLGVTKRHLINHVELEKSMNEDSFIELCSEACEKAMEKADISINEIGYFIAVYDVSPILSPGLSQLLTRNVGFDPYIKHVNVQGVASTAFPKALELADDHLALHPQDHVLICVSGVSSFWFQNQVRNLRNVMEISQISQIKDEKRRQMELQKWMATMEFFLFGDGVAACIVTNKGKEEGVAVKKVVEVTNVKKKDYLAGCSRLTAINEPFKFGFYSHLDKKIPELGVKYTCLALERLLGKNTESIVKAAKKWVVHTGSEKILDALAEHNGISQEKLRESYEILKENGNLAGASLPFILERIVSENKLRIGDIILMVGYGWGFSAAAALLEYQKCSQE